MINPTCPKNRAKKRDFIFHSCHTSWKTIGSNLWRGSGFLHLIFFFFLCVLRQVWALRVTSIPFVYSMLPFLIWVMILVNIQSIQLYACHLLLDREIACLCLPHRKGFSSKSITWCWHLKFKRSLLQYLGLSNQSQVDVHTV